LGDGAGQTARRWPCSDSLLRGAVELRSVFRKGRSIASRLRRPSNRPRQRFPQRREAVRFLCDVLERMQGHQEKKRAMLRKLRVSRVL